MFRIIIADDEPIVRKGLQMLVNWEGMDCQVVYIAENGRELIDAIAGSNPDIVITDIRMPDMDGLQVAKYIYDNGLPAKVIFLTAYADFSYAKAALEYGVVDYVTKTGAFDGLEKAVERAKQVLLNERSQRWGESCGAVTEGFLKSLIDGSVYENDEIRARAALAQIELENFLVMIFRFRADATFARKQKREIHDSLINFFGMAFHKQKPYILSVRRNLFCVILDRIIDDYEDSVRACCNDITDIIQNFMKLDVFIGISGVTTDLTVLKTAYDQAEAAISGHSFHMDNKRLFFYKKDYMGRQRNSLGEYEQIMETLCHHIQKGNRDEALAAFSLLLSNQQDNGFPVEEIKNSGIFLEGCCRRYLAKYNVLLSDILDAPMEVSKKIFGALIIDDYRGVMVTLIEAVTTYIHQSVNKKNLLIYDCNKLIDRIAETGTVNGVLNVTDISRRIGVSASYLSRIYKEKTGMTIINAINKKKLSKAKELMEQTDLRIYEIADRLGFENTTYFSHFFKKHMGIAPIEYKKRIAEKTED